MTPSDAIITALRQSNTSMTQGELANATGLDARAVRETCHALGAAGRVVYRHGWYSLGVEG